MEFTLRLTQEEVYTMSNALGHRPYLEVVALINKLQAQITEQELAASEAASKRRPPKVK